MRPYLDYESYDRPAPPSPVHATMAPVKINQPTNQPIRLQGQLKVVQYLIEEAGADPDKPMAEGASAPLPTHHFVRWSKLADTVGHRLGACKRADDV